MDRSIQGPLVSIVIPVFNAEQYLENAIQCIAGQTYKNLEIICVNDGSNDRSGEILEKWEDRDPRFHIITQDNQGAGYARNVGMSFAKGKYIIFLDADDVFQKQMIRTLVRTAEKNDTDIIVFGYYKFSDNKREKIQYPAKRWKVPIGKVISPTEISDRLFQADHGMPWNKFYKTEFVKRSKASFQLLRNTNDELFSRVTTVEAGRILFLDKTFVGYRIGNRGSIQGSLDQSTNDFLIALTAIHDELKKRNYYDTYYKTYQVLFSYSIMWRLEEKDDPDAFNSLAKEISDHTLRDCELDEDYINDQYKGVYRALQKRDISMAAFEMDLLRKREEEMSINHDVKNWLRRCRRNILKK